MKVIQRQTKYIIWLKSHNYQYTLLTLAKMDSLEKFCLKWDDFKQNIVSSFHGLRKDNNFSDVTLVCEDKQKIEAHRIILTACSPFFSSVLNTNNHSHPIIYMRGVKAKDMVPLMDFMYQGEANIYQDDLDSFLALAEELQLMGLTTSETEPMASHKDVIHNPRVNTKKKSSSRENNIDANPNEIDFKFGSHKHNDLIVPVKNGRMLESADIEYQQTYINSMMERIHEGNIRWKCTVCGKASRDRKDMSRHIETHIEGMSYPCTECGKVSRSSNALKSHFSSFHRN